MKIALAQIDVQAGNPNKNIIKMLDYIEKSKKEDYDIVAFPEMCISGYMVGDKWLDDDFCKEMMSFNQKIIDASEGICVIWGNIFIEENKNKIYDNGLRRRYNAAYIYKDKNPLKRTFTPIVGDKIYPDGVTFKTLLPNYRYFDDKRYFSSFIDNINSGKIRKIDAFSPFVFEKENKKYYIGIQLCEDLWCEDYNLNPTEEMVRHSDVIINLSASPWTYGKNHTRDKKIKYVTNWYKYNNIDFLYVNCVGSQNNGKNILTFDGGTTIYREGIPIVLSKKPYEEELVIYNSEGDFYPVERKIEEKIFEKYQAICQGIQHISKVTTINKYVIGLSGGIDSAVVCCLLVKVLGKENVIAVNMPSEFNSNKTKKAAKDIAEKLGIKYIEVPIGEISLSIENAIKKAIGKTEELNSLTLENVQAKVRGTSILSGIAGELGCLFSNNGNKIETAIGYATLYGDVNGAIAPIADLTKVEVFELGKYLNTHIFEEEIIPGILFPNNLYQFTEEKIQPSAELKELQVDPIKIGYHCALIEKLMDYKKINPNEIMKWWLSGKLHEKLKIEKMLLYNYNLDDGKTFIDDLKWFCQKITGNVFKRIQSPPIIVTSKTAFGFDLRESILPTISMSFDENLVKEILSRWNY